MEKNKKSTEQELVESIALMIDKGLSGTTNIYSGTVKSISGKKAVVIINGQEQMVNVCSLSSLVGKVTRVFVPDGNMSNAFILTT